MAPVGGRRAQRAACCGKCPGAARASCSAASGRARAIRAQPCSHAAVLRCALCERAGWRLVRGPSGRAAAHHGRAGHLVSLPLDLGLGGPLDERPQACAQRQAVGGVGACDATACCAKPLGPTGQHLRPCVSLLTTVQTLRANPQPGSRRACSVQGVPQRQMAAGGTAAGAVAQQAGMLLPAGRGCCLPAHVHAPPLAGADPG